MKKRNPNESGITLIAVVITIIILLILAAVTLGAISGDNGLIARTKDAKAQHETVTANEDDQLAALRNTAKEMQGNGDEGTTNRSVIAVGDYIDYKPDEAGSYSKENLTYDKTGMRNNTSNIVQSNIKWQILKINNDNSIKLIGTPTSKSVYFTSNAGYNNGVLIMNDICKTLYSKESEGITARSVNLKDFEENLTQAGKNARSAYVNRNSVQYQSSKEYTGFYSHKPDIFGKTNDESDPYYSTPTTNDYIWGGYSDKIRVNQTFYYIPTNEENYGQAYKALYNDTFTWVASRFVDCISYCATFGLRGSRTGISGADAFNSDGNSVGYGYGFRPVVTLNSSTKIKASPTATDINGTPHTITKY